MPKGTPDEVIDRLQRATVAMIETPGLDERLKKVRLDFRCRSRRSLGIPEGFPRQRDREMGRDHQGERSDSGLMTRCRNPIRLSNSQARITTCSAQQARSHA